MRMLIALAMAAVASIGSAAAEVRLRIDASQATAILDAYERQDAAAADAIAAMRPTQELIAHHAPFSDQITLEHFRDSLRDALSGQARSDLWGFHRLAQNGAAVRGSIEAITSDPAAFARDLEAIIAPYTPAHVVLDVDVGLVIGTPGAGWTDRPGEFFFEIGRAAGDLEGAKVVCAHELYHLVLAQVQPAPRLPENTRLGQLERGLLGAINEGMATHVGRFTSGDTGAMSRISVNIERTNMRRMRQNFRLMDAMILALMRTRAISADDVGAIAFGGVYDEPGYYVFRDMAAAIEAAQGREALVALLSQPPSRFVLTYHEVAPADALRLHEETLAEIRALDRRLARR